MAIHLPLVPYDLGTNPIYEHMMADRKNNIESWDQEEMAEKYGEIHLEKLLKKKYLFEIENYQLIPSYKFFGTPTNLILRYVSSEICAFSELMDKMPKHLQHPPLIKNLLAFLHNFQLVQCFTPPASALTYGALEDIPEIESAIDEIYAFSSIMEDSLAYKMDPFEHAQELSKIIENF